MLRARLRLLGILVFVLAGLVGLIAISSGGPAEVAAEPGPVRVAATPSPRLWVPVALNALETGGLGPVDPKKWTVASRWTQGPAHKSVVVGETTYFASGAQLEVLNTAGQTVTVQATLPLTAPIRDMVLQSPYLLMANGDAGIVMANVQAAVTPTVVGARSESSKAVRIEVKDQRAYVLYENVGLKVYDISNTANISETASLFFTGPFSAIARKDTALYIGTSTGSLLVVDISDDFRPRQVTVPGTGGSGAISDLLAFGDRLYLVQGSQLMVFNVASILAPAKQGTYTAPDNKTLRSIGLDAVNNRAYVVQDVSPSGFRTIDVTSPTLPQEINSFVNTAGPALKAVYADNRLHLTAQSRYQVIDLAVPQDQPERRGRNAFGALYDLEVSGNSVYVAGDSGGIALLDVGVPERPVEITRWTPAGWSRGLAISGTTIYSVQVVDGDGIRLIAGSFLTPTAPILLGVSDKIALPLGELGRPFEVTIGAGYAYVAGSGAGLLTFDIRGATPVLTKQDTNVNARSVDVNGPVLYVGAPAGANAVLRTYDVSLNPASPTIIGQLNLSFNGDPGEMLVEQGSLFANIAGALNIVGVAVPYVPSISGSAGTPTSGGRHYGVTKLGSYAYLTDPVRGQVHVFNVSQINRPTLYTDLTFAGEPAALNDTNNLLLISDSSAGVVVLN